MNTSILWRDACAMSKALRKQLVASAVESSLQNPIVMVRALMPSTPWLHPISRTASGENDLAPTSTLRMVPDGNPGPKDGLFLAQARKPKGFFKRTPPQVFMTEEGLLNQLAVYGSAGAGKTETLLTLALNATHGGPRSFDRCVPAYKSKPRSVFYFDGKGDNGLWAKAFSGMSERGILGNLRVINLMTGSRDIHPDDRRFSHTLDLFDGFDEQTLTRWLLAMRPTYPGSPSGEAWDKESSTVLAVVGRLAMATAQAGEQRIKPDLLLHLLTQAGAQDASQGLPPENSHLAKRFEAMTWGPHANPVWRQTAEVMHAWLKPLVSVHAHVFNTAHPQVSLADLAPTQNVPKAVMVLGRAMERNRDQCAAERAILISLRLCLEKRPSLSGCDTVLLLDEFNYVLPPTEIDALSRLRDRGAGIVWATESLHLTPGFNETGPAVGWKPATHVFMRHCLEGHIRHDSRGESYFESQTNTHSFLKHVVPSDIRGLAPGEAFVWDGEGVVKTEMNYADVPRVKVLFIPPAKALPAPTYAFSGGALNLWDEQRQVQVLSDRLSEWKATHQEAPPLSWCQETVARMLGYANWHEAHQRLSKPNA